jgi:uncharacterized protein YjbJ (UPF0337 family)
MQPNKRGFVGNAFYVFPIKQGAGKLSGDKELEHEGKADKAKGDLHEAAGNVKDAARKTADSLKK